MLRFVGPIIVVDEIAPSRYFYEHLLGQKVKYDFGVNVAFEGDFAIHLKSHFQALLGDVTRYPVAKKAHNGDLCFETDEIETIYQGLKQAAVEFVHVIQEQPWGQRVMRLYDPDGHVVEIGETMEAVVSRFYRLGWSTDRIREKTGMPREFIEQVVQKQSGADQASGG